MDTRTKAYLSSVILPGLLALAWAAAHWTSADAGLTAAYVAVATVFAVAKIRLPGLAGTFSLTFLPVLYGVRHFSAPEVIAASAVAAVAGSLLNARRRPTLLQIVFNAANLTLSSVVCLLVFHLLGDSIPYLPALLCLVVTVFFAFNTVLVSGIISLSAGKPLGAVCEAWYLWSFIYYLAGATALGLAMSSTGDLVSWLVLGPVLYMICFFWSLRSQTRQTLRPDSGNAIPRRAARFVVALTGAGALLVAASIASGPDVAAGRFALVLAAAAATAACKVRLPGMTGSVSVSFVVMLFAISEMRWAETLAIGIAAALVQSYWNVSRRPKPMQAAFNAATIVVSASAAVLASRAATAVLPAGGELLPSLLAATAAYYLSNTLLVCTVLGLIEQKTVSAIWNTCRFWSLPYTLVGTAVSGIMVAVARSTGFPAAITMLSVMGLVFLAYRVHVKQAGPLQAPAPAAA